MNTPSLHSSFQKAAVASLLMSAILAGCGGGGSEPAPSPSPTPTPAPAPVPGPAPAPTPSSDVSPSCSNCSALSPTNYSGTGVGIWHYSNPSGAATKDVKVNITGITNKAVTLVFTNQTAENVDFPALLNPMAPVPSGSSHRAEIEEVDTSYRHNEVVERFNTSGFLRFTKNITPVYFANLAASAPSPAVVGDSRSFRHHDGVARATTLKHQVAASDGRIVNFWVESSEFAVGRMTDSHLSPLASAFTKPGGIYDQVVDLGGSVWGPHKYDDLIPAAGQPLDVVFLNFNRDSKAFGEVGYFYGLNAVTRARAPNSNESLSLYMDTETLYLGGNRGLSIMKTTLAHEGLHMANFYRRSIKRDTPAPYDTWLEEMTAMVMEDIASKSIDPAFNTLRDSRYPDYLSYGSYNCPLLEFTGFGDTCESYSVSGAFGGFLVRQMGVPLFKGILNSVEPNSPEVLEKSIKAIRPASSIAEEMRKFAALAIPALPRAGAPAGFDFPSHSSSGYSLDSVDAQALKYLRTLPTSAPAQLRGYGSFPVVRNAVSGTFSETVKVPSGVALSVIVN